MSDDEGPDPFEGAGVVSSYADVVKALSENQIDPLQVVYTAAGAGLDTLGVVTDPLGSLLTAGIGWLIEHVDFLSEPLDALAGDPDEIRAQAKTWHAVSVRLGSVAADYRSEVEDLSGGWDGAAAHAYALAVERCATGLDRAAADAAQLCELVVTSGAAVGTLRALIRDTIASFIADVIQWVLAALAASVATAGFSLAALIAAVVEQAVSLARSCVRRISALLDLLDEAGTSAARLGEAVRDTAAELARTTRNTAGEMGSTLADPVVVATRERMAEVARDHVAGVIPDHVEGDLDTLDTVAERVGAARWVEAGKQMTSEKQKQRNNWK